MRRNDGPRPFDLPISVRTMRVLALGSNLEEALSRKLTRRTLLQTAAAAGVTALNAPFVSGAHAAGKLSCGFWDHWVPTALDPMRKICQEWADKNKVDLNIDFITSNGDKLLLTIAAEAQAKSGHDILSIPTWYASAQADNLVPMDDVMQKLIDRKSTRLN